MGKWSSLTQTTHTARSRLLFWSRRCGQGDSTLGTLTDQSPFHNLPLIYFTTMTIVSRRDPREILEVEVVAWTNRDHRVDMVERRVLVAINSNIWFSAILFRIQNCSNPCAASGNSSRIGKPQQMKDCPGRGRRKRMPGNTLNLLAPVLTNMYFTTGQVNFCVTDPCLSQLDPYVLTATHASR